MGQQFKITLDRDRSFGEVRGEVINVDDRVATFCQDGMYFDNDGRLMEKMLTQAQRDKIEKDERERAALDVAKEKTRQVLIDAGLDPDSIDLQAVKRKDAAEPRDEEIDLDAWANEEVTLPWTKVREAFKDQYSYSPSNKAAAIKFLAEKGTGFKDANASEID